MRVLWATANVPDPAAGGGAGHEHELLRWACAHHQVTLVAGGLLPDDERPAALDDLGLDDVVQVGVPRPEVPAKPELLVRSLGGPPLEFWMAREKVAAVGAAVAARDADLVHVMWPESAPVAIESAGRRPTAFFPSDSFVRHEDRELEAATTVRQRVYRRLQRRRTVRWERSYRDAGAVAVASSIDAAGLAALGVHASVLPVALDDDWFAPSTVVRRPDLVDFVADLGYGPNRDAARWLVEDIWPRVRAERPAARLELVGRRPEADLLAAAHAAGATVHADVPDVRPYYRAAAVLVSPVRLGSGMRNKVLHGVACEAPLVATSTAVEGIGLVEGEHHLQAEDAEGLARAIVAALDDPDASAARARRAAAVAAGYRTDVVGPRLDELWDRARRERGR